MVPTKKVYCFYPPVVGRDARLSQPEIRTFGTNVPSFDKKYFTIFRHLFSQQLILFIHFFALATHILDCDCKIGMTGLWDVRVARS